MSQKLPPKRQESVNFNRSFQTIFRGNMGIIWVISFFPVGCRMGRSLIIPEQKGLNDPEILWRFGVEGMRNLEEEYLGGTNPAGPLPGKKGLRPPGSGKGFTF